MKSLTWLLECILQDCSIRCGTDTHRDFVTLSRRVEHEGISFLTITLPNFCKDFERSLEQEFVDPTAFVGFHKAGALPRFLGGLLGLVFDREDGTLLDDPPEWVIQAIRQICLVCKKIHLECSHQRTKEAFDGFVQCENDIRRTFQSALPWGTPGKGDPHNRQELWERIRKDYKPVLKGLGNRRQYSARGRSSYEDPYHLFGVVADVVWSNVLARAQLDVENAEVRPRHGPGATAERITGNQKYVHKRWHSRLEPYFPFTAFGIVSLNALDEESTLADLDIVEPGAEQPVRVISVPKTLSAPRIIAIEPVCMQYTQQALASTIVKSIEKHPLTAGHVNFSDQSINRELALVGSKTQDIGTLDLSEASDRVHLELVKRLLQTVPALRDAVLACRSTSAEVPGYDTPVVLEKFASMGSALCFPIEAMVFYTICLVARLRDPSVPITSRSIYNASRGLYVYGDDLIVPADEVPAVAATLELFGLKVNTRKTFRNGKFRESCGMDAYNGVQVTPVYLRRMPPCDRRDTEALVSFVSFANQLYKNGWWRTARRVREEVAKLFGNLPHVQETSPCLGWYSFLGTMSVTRYERDLQRPVVKGYVVKPQEPEIPSRVIRLS